MSRAQALRLGPFTGGMNTASDPTAVADSELVECQNLELDLDGSLVCRPPLRETTNNSGATTERLVMIGRAVFAGGTYVIASNADGTFAFDGTTWSTIKLGLKSRVAVQYQDNLYIVPMTGSAQSGGRWDGTTFTTDANIPNGEAAVFHKARMFVVPGISAAGTAAHQLRFTDVIGLGVTAFSWAAGNVISVSQGDGEKLMDIVIYNDNLLLFKENSTYVLAYDTDPAKAILRKINSVIGASARNNVVVYETSCFVLHSGYVFEITNYDFNRINIKVPFLFDGGAPSTRAENTFISLFGDRLLVRYYNRIYVFGLRTRTWSRWQSASTLLHNFGQLILFPANPTQNALPKYYAGSSIQSVKSIFVIADGFDGATDERDLVPNLYDINCNIQTKNYDYADSHHFKKLMWWGVDVISNRNAIGIATPIVAGFQVFWNDLHAKTWTSLHASTWDQPLTAVADVQTTATDNLAIGRKFIKFLKALRFRQIYFRVNLLCNGTTAQGPCRIFTITVLVASKETVVAQVS